MAQRSDVNQCTAIAIDEACARHGAVECLVGGGLVFQFSGDINVAAVVAIAERTGTGDLDGACADGGIPGIGIGSRKGQAASTQLGECCRPRQTAIHRAGRGHIQAEAVGRTNASYGDTALAGEAAAGRVQGGRVGGNAKTLHIRRDR